MASGLLRQTNQHGSLPLEAHSPLKVLCTITASKSTAALLSFSLVRDKFFNSVCPWLFICSTADGV